MDDFDRLVETEKLLTIKHNDNDYAAFRDFARSLDERFDVIEKDRERAERSRNLTRWDESLAYPWNEAKLSSLRDKKAVSQALQLIKIDSSGSFFVKGERGSGKTFLALAIVRKLIGLGHIVPSNVKHTSETEFLTLARSGFKFESRMSELLDPNHKLFLMDDVGDRGAYSEIEILAWSRFFDHCSKNGSILVFTCSISASGFSSKFASSSIQSKVAFFFQNRIVETSGVVRPPELVDYETEEESRALDLLEEKDSVFRNVARD